VIGFRAPDNAFLAKWWTVRNENKNSEIRVSQRIFHHVLDTADAVLFDDAVTHFHSADSVLAGSLRSVMCAPLTDPEGKVFGMIQTDSHAAHRFQKNDLDIFATVATQISLALNFSKLHLRTIEDALIRKDIEQANTVQRQFLPQSAPKIQGYAFADYYSAARHVGGDYFDYLPLCDGRLAIVLGDVVGKGVPAALTMVKLATEMRTTFEVVTSASAAMTRLNRRLADSFITGVVMILDPKQHVLSIANAGHDSPLLKSATGQLHKFGEDAKGFPISVVDDYEYEEAEVALSPGDTVVVFSDGFIDAENTAQTNRFGIDRINRIVETHTGSAESVTRAIVDEVDVFTSGAPQFDDMCLVSFQRTN
jgi:phosphoserine phosphatase RsbU/P